jgi:hypothetical protein
MGDMSAIEWTDATWNPTTGCDRTSPGCDKSYELSLAKRLKAMGVSMYTRQPNVRELGSRRGGGLMEQRQGEGQRLRVEAIPGEKPPWGLWLVLSALTRGAFDRATSKGRRPYLAVYNRKGDELQLFPASNWEEALVKRDRLRQELAEMDLDVWCDRYIVPGDFVAGKWPPPGGVPRRRRWV